MGVPGAFAYFLRNYKKYILVNINKTMESNPD